MNVVLMLRSRTGTGIRVGAPAELRSHNAIRARRLAAEGGLPPPSVPGRRGPPSTQKRCCTGPHLSRSAPSRAQTCRNAAVRKEVSDAIIKAMVGVKSAEISPQNLVVRFSEAVDGFPLPKGYSDNPELQAPSKDN
jgi:hypothetical protein